ncbi:TonB-dependent receptor [Caenimonas terrae]|uniref:TonB-dependent receptor n=1 Tax=Caenimonas terrae TaxID=696074 RepID=A0ABW0NFE3_9BURK
MTATGPLRRAAMLAGLAPLLAFAQPPDADAVHALQPVEVFGRTPLPGLVSSPQWYPGNVQLVDDGAIERGKAVNLPDFMKRQLTGVTVNEVQGSPFQLDVNYRGHRLSPTLGTAQGLSVYLDGVRVNEAFGDVMNWDLLPEAAVASLALMPGSNPLFGLSTLGGALVLTTKSGLSHKGTEADFSVSSTGRRRLDLGHGVQWQGGWHGYAAATLFDDSGWRERSPGRLANLFLKLGRRQGADDWSLSWLAAGSRLTGNGPLSQSLYDVDPRAGYTFSDTTRSRTSLLNFSGTRSLASGDKLSLVAWHREGRRQGSNGDVADAADGDAGAPAAVLNDSTATQRSSGAGLQWTRQAGRHQFALGADASASRIGYQQSTQAGSFDVSRLAVADPGAPIEQQVALSGTSRQAGLFATDIVSIGERTQLTLSARWDRTRVSNTLTSGGASGTEAFTFSKLNPALGLAHAFSPTLNVFANLSQGTRVPTVLELGCADPARPCVLPTGLQSDPALRQVVARTGEFGFRARPLPPLQLSAALFRTVSQDDILFLRSGVSQAGYFTNVGQTLRQGFELSARWRKAPWQWHADYSHLDATYRSQGTLPGPLSTPQRPDSFRPGTPIAGLPRQVLKLGIDWQATPALTLGADWLAAGSQVVAGNESGNRPELGRLAGYAVLDARVVWQLQSRWQAWARAGNVLDKRYATFATGNRDFFPGGRALGPGQEAAASRFLAPGTGRSLTLGLRYEWDE